MIGAIIIVFVLLVFIPVSVLMSGGAFAGILSTFLKKDAETRYEGSELLQLEQ